MNTLPVELTAGVLGGLYSAALWYVARRVARARTIALGATPRTAFALCGLAAATIVAAFPGSSAAALAAAAIGATMCAIVDARTGLIFDALTLGMAGVGVVLALRAGSLPAGLVAAAAVGGGLLALHLLTRRRGLGMGDVKLGAAVGLGFGLPLGMLAIGSAFVIGAVYALALVGSGRARRSDAIRFGPFIAGGAVAGLTLCRLGFSW